MKCLTAALIIALTGFGTASASDLETQNGEAQLVEGTENAMHVVDLENVTVYGDRWEQIAPGVMERQTENGFVRHIFGDDGLAWKIQSLTDEAFGLRFKAEKTTDGKVKLIKLEGRIDELEALQKSGAHVGPISGRLDPCGDRDFDLTADGGEHYNNYQGYWYYNSFAHVTNHLSGCEATSVLSVYLDIQSANYSYEEERVGTWYDEHAAVVLYSDPVPCWEYASSASYEDSRYFEVTSYGSTNCW